MGRRMKETVGWQPSNKKSPISGTKLSRLDGEDTLNLSVCLFKVSVLGDKIYGWWGWSNVAVISAAPPGRSSVMGMTAVIWWTVMNRRSNQNCVSLGSDVASSRMSCMECGSHCHVYTNL